MAASGVRSSWLASAANRRSRASLAARRARADSTCPSIRLNATATWPTSVRGLASGTRSGRVTSPLASGSWVTRVAVAATRRSGRSDSRTNPVPMKPARTSAARNAASSAISTLCSVVSMGDSGSPVMSTSPSSPLMAVSRYSPWMDSRSMV